jgi:hypothetical protein
MSTCAIICLCGWLVAGVLALPPLVALWNDRKRSRMRDEDEDNDERAEW